MHARFARVVGWFDRYFVDGVLNVLSAWTLRAGDALRGIQTGQPQDYVYGVAFGVLVLFVWMQLACGHDVPRLVRRHVDAVRGRPPHHVHGAPLAARRAPLAVTTTAISTVLSLWIYVRYDREAAGFQFYEKLPLVPPLGISYQLAVDGMALLMVLLTSIIIFAGVFASWTVRRAARSSTPCSWPSSRACTACSCRSTSSSSSSSTSSPCSRCTCSSESGVRRERSARAASSRGRTARPGWAPRSTRR